MAVGFIGAAGVNAGSLENPSKNTDQNADVIALIKDIQFVNEVNAINAGMWRQDSYDVTQDSLALIEELFKEDDSLVETVKID